MQPPYQGGGFGGPPMGGFPPGGPQYPQPGGYGQGPPPPQQPQGMSGGAKVATFGCGGCGCLFVLGGLTSILLAMVGAVNRSEIGTAIGIGIGNLVIGGIGVIVA